MAPSGTTDAAPPLWCRPGSAAVIVMVAYVGLSLLMSSGGSLGADTGAKVATLEVMQERGSWRPEVGYWAAEWDPGAEVHGLQQSVPAGDDYVVVTTLPMLLLAHPLYDLGGYKLALLLPMFGGLGAAFGCRAIADRLGDERAGWVSFWLVSLASPLVLYALDLWEHAPGAALMVWSVVLLLDVAMGRGGRFNPIVAGTLLGAASTLRSEAFVAALVATAAACLAAGLRGRSVLRPVRVGLSVIAGFAIPWLLNMVLEKVLLEPAPTPVASGGGGLDRASRVERLVRGAGFRAADRLHEGALSLFATYSSLDVPATWPILSGVVAVILLLLAVWRWTAGETRVAALMSAGATAMILVPVLDGPGWIPGGWVAFPAAAVGLLALRCGGPLRWTAVACLVAYPVTWAVQYLDAAVVQWGGRYALAVTLVLGTCGICAVARTAPEALRLIVVPCLAVTLLGVGWMSYRTHEIEQLFDQLVERPEDVIFASYGVFIREGMAAYDERRWLAASSKGDVADAAEVVEEAGLTSLGVLDESPTAPPSIGDFELTGRTRYEATGVTIYVHSYELTDR